MDSPDVLLVFRQKLAYFLYRNAGALSSAEVDPPAIGPDRVRAPGILVVSRANARV
jgi:hypothetical protein